VSALHRGSRNAATFARASGAAAALFVVACAATSSPARPRGLIVRAPRLPVTDTVPAPSSPPKEDPVKVGVFARINSDRAAAGLPPVAWDEAASKVADSFCAAQIAEGTRGHFLTDGVPPYARTAFAGISGMGSENSVAWLTTAPAFGESALALALAGHEDMMRETPPNDGHRRAILDPEATHVGVGWFMKGGSFRMTEEFLTRKLATLTLESDGGTLLVRGRPLTGYSLQFVTIAREAEPEKISKDEARSRNAYTYPEPRLGLVAEGRRSMRVVGVDTNDLIRVGGTGEFSFRWAPSQAGLWTMVFYVAEARERARPGGLAVVWMAAAAGK
jgi:uncharacterized protein YkwD